MKKILTEKEFEEQVLKIPGVTKEVIDGETYFKGIEMNQDHKAFAFDRMLADARSIANDPDVDKDALRKLVHLLCDGLESLDAISVSA